MKTRVAVILVNWNGWEDTIECIDSLLSLTDLNFHIYVIDNFSIDDSVEKIKTWLNSPIKSLNYKLLKDVNYYSVENSGLKIPFRIVNNQARIKLPLQKDNKVTLILSDINLGFAGGNNLGIKLAIEENFDYFWLLNNDTVVTKQALHALIAEVKDKTNLGIVGSTLVYYHEPQIIQAMGGGFINVENFSFGHIGLNCPLSKLTCMKEKISKHIISYIVGASMFVSKKFIEDIGLMQEDYFLYFEELDWAIRSKGRFDLSYAPDSIVYHKAGGSTMKKSSLNSLYHLYKNQLRFTARFYPEKFNTVRTRLFKELCILFLKCDFARAKLLASILLKSNQYYFEFNLQNYKSS